MSDVNDAYVMRRRTSIPRRREPAPRRSEERASGEEAIVTRQAREAEVTPSHMNRLKTSQL
jgi:hypothetical protein